LVLESISKKKELPSAFCHRSIFRVLNMILLRSSWYSRGFAVLQNESQRTFVNVVENSWSLDLFGRRGVSYLIIINNNNIMISHHQSSISPYPSIFCNHHKHVTEITVSWPLAVISE
jgi:hypothetical protein